MSTIKRRLDALERATTHQEPPRYVVRWANELDETLYQDERGQWFDRETNEPVFVIQLKWETAADDFMCATQNRSSDK